MNIYLVLYNDTNNVWKRHFESELVAMGHHLLTVPNLGLDHGWKLYNAGKNTKNALEQTSELLLSDVRKQHEAHGIDCLIAMLRPHQVRGEIFKQIEGLGIPTALYECDNLNSPLVRQQLSPHFTVTGVSELDALALYRNDKIPHLHLPMASSPKLFYPVTRPETREVTFVGSKNAYRRMLLGTAVAKGLPLEIFGGGWNPNTDYYSLDVKMSPSDPRYVQTRFEKIQRWIEFKISAVQRLVEFGPGVVARGKKNNALGLEFEEAVARVAHRQALSFDQVLDIYAESKVSLGINQYTPPSQHSDPRNVYSRNRDTEAPMAGACYLTEFCPELDLLYPEKDVIWTFVTPEEMVEKANFLRKNDAFRLKMRHRAHQYAMEHHRWVHRFEQLFKHLGLNARQNRKKGVA